METTKVILQGGGQHALVVIECLLSQGAEVVALFDPKFDDHLFDIPQRGEYDPNFEPNLAAIIAIGENAIRKRVVGKTKHKFTNAIHSSVIFSRYAIIGTGNMILQGAIVQAQTTIGNHVIINTGTQVDHDCLVEDYTHLAPGVVLCGNVRIGEGAFVGAGAVVLPGKTIGAWATVGAGAVVVDDIPDHAVAVGNPAKIIKYSTV